MIDDIIFINEEINKIFESYIFDFHKHLSIKLEKNTTKVKLEDIFILVDKDIENDFKNAESSNSILYNLKSNDSNLLDYEQIRLFFRIYFLSVHCNLLDDIKNFDYIEQIFMKINKYLSQIIKNDDLYILARYNKSLISISWSEQAILSEKGSIFQNIVNQPNRSISNNINGGELLCYSNSIFNEEQKKLINIYFLLSRTLYNHYFDRILLMNGLNNYSFGDKELEIDIEYYKTNKKLKYIGKHKKEVNILHLSDMHITSNDENYAVKFLSNFKKTELYKFENEKFNKLENINEKEIDIIVVTGDIANAGTSSKEMLANYDMASKEIKKIAQFLLGNTWKERLLIVPGNHDYGMINELKINLQDRSYKSVDLSKDSTEFEKFIFFYLIFENELLNGKIENMSQLSHPKKVEYNISDDKKISFFLFNTAYYANTIRSNKIRLKYDNSIMNNTKDINILLMHHTPMLEINYYFDTCTELYEYKEFIYGCMPIEQEHICNKFNVLEEIKVKNENIDEIVNFLDTLIEKLESKDDSLNLNDSIETLQELLEKNCKDKMIAQNSKIIKDIQQFDNLDMVKYPSIKVILKKIIKENKSKYDKIKQKNILLNKYLIADDKTSDYDEVFQFEKNRINSFFVESRVDKDKYLKTFYKYLNKFGECIILGGHYHKQRIKFIDNYTVCEVGKTFDKSIYKFGILSIDTETKEKKYYSSIELEKEEDKYYSEI